MSLCAYSLFSSHPPSRLYLFSQPISVAVVPAISALVIYPLYLSLTPSSNRLTLFF